MNKRKKKELVKDWLKDKHCVIWSTFSIADDEGRERAADWFLAQIESFKEYKA